MRRFLFVALMCLPVSAWADHYADVVGANSPYLYWKMDESSGTTITNYGTFGTASNYNLTTHNTPSLGQSGVNAQRHTSIGWASASSQWADVTKDDTGTGPGDFAAGSRTVECWVKPSNIAVIHSMISFQKTTDSSCTSGNWAWEFLWGGKFQLNILQTGSNTCTNWMSVTSVTSPANGSWFMVDGVYTSTTPKVEIYVNGASDASSTTTTGSGLNAGSIWSVARRSFAQDHYAAGNLSDCAVYGSAQTAGSISARYNAGIQIIGGWSWLTRRPELPRFRDDDYFTKMVRNGYADGFWDVSAMSPHALRSISLTVGLFPNFAAVPDGHGN